MKLITLVIFDSITTDFGRTIIRKKVTSATKPDEFSRILVIYFISYNRICDSAISSSCSHWQVFRELKVIPNLEITAII